jgi:hypothetical protein
VLEVAAALLVTVRVMSAALIVLSMVRSGCLWRRCFAFEGRSRWSRTFGRGRVRRSLAVRRRFRWGAARGPLHRFYVGRRLRRIAFFGVSVRAGIRARVCGWPSWTRTAAPATGAATFVHVVERELVDEYSVRPA